MDDWASHKLGELVVFRKGVKVDVFNDVRNGLVPYLGASSIEGSTTPQWASPRGAVIAETSDVLMLWDGERSGLVGGNLAGAVASTVARLRPRDWVDPRFLRHALRAQYGWIQARRTGTGVPHVPKDLRTWLTLRHPVDLHVQRHIATLLDTAEEDIRDTRRSIGKLRLLKAGLYELLFDTPAKSRALSSLVTAPICYGIVQPGSYHPQGVELITIGDARRKLAGDLFRVAPTLDQSYARSRVCAGDVVTSVKGTIGVVLVVPEGFSGNISRDVARIRLRDDLLPEYLSRYFESPAGQRVLEKSVVGTTRAEISIGVLNRLKVPVPSREEQIHVVSVLADADHRIQAEEALLAKCELIHDGLMDELIFKVGCTA